MSKNDQSDKYIAIIQAYVARLSEINHQVIELQVQLDAVERELKALKEAENDG